VLALRIRSGISQQGGKEDGCVFLATFHSTAHINT
jgi:hypothetical protein